MNRRKFKLIQYITRLKCLHLCLYLWLSFIFFPTNAAEPISEEYKIKAALIYKITRFVEWPKQIKRKTRERFGLCVLGRNDFGSALDKLKGKTIGGAPISIQHFKQSKSIKQYCQLVFISDSKQAFLKAILRSLYIHPILTIGDSPNFAENGGMIQLSYNNKQFDFKINLNSVKGTGLKISAPLLEMATIVDTKQRSKKR